MFYTKPAARPVLCFIKSPGRVAAGCSDAFEEEVGHTATKETIAVLFEKQDEFCIPDLVAFAVTDMKINKPSPLYFCRHTAERNNYGNGELLPQ